MMRSSPWVESIVRMVRRPSMGQKQSMCRTRNGCRRNKLIRLQLRNVEEPRMTAETAPSSTMAPPSGETPANYCYHPEYARMEAWLDEHPDFAADYFVRKATRNMVDAWLVAHATSMSTGSSMESSSLNIFPGQGGQGSGSSRGNSGATTPVRKISAHEFERGGLLKPMVSNVDGTPTFLSLAAPEGQPLVGSPNAVFSPVLGSRSPRRSRNELRNLDEKELIFELVKDICNDLDVRSLCHKILQNVSMLLQADRCSLFLVRGERLPPCPDCSVDDENGRCNRCASSERRHLVSKLFDVCSRSTLQEMERKEEIIIPWGTGIVGFVAERGEPVNIPDAYKDDRFNHDIDARTGYTTRTLLCMPIKDINGDVLGVAQVINKTNDSCFTAADENVFAKYLQFCGIGLKNAQLYEKSQLEIKRNQVLLDLARVIFEEQTTMENMVYKILVHTQSLIQCHRVQVLLIHEGSAGIFSRVFDFEATDLEIEDEDGEPRKKPYEGRFPINIGITGQVAANGNTINIPDVYIDQRFDPSVDLGSDFTHKSVLCMPIRDSTSKIIGVIQLVNKFADLAFTKNDENFVEAFAIFCGLAIHNTNIYERAVMAMAKQNVTLEVLSYHASASLEDAKRLKTLRVPSSQHFGLHDFTFDDVYFSDDETLTACIRMFVDLDFIERFHIDYEVLCRWLLSVKKNYRNVTYHNWRHAFNVAQMMFAILTATQWWKILGEIECLSLLIACLCHDLDHRGTNNSFQVKASSPLAQLYTTSTMEHHHFDQCIMILNSQGNQILANVTSDEYTKVVKLLEEAILATDLAVYFRKRGAFVTLVRSKNYDWYVDEHRELLRGMMMTICDLAAITKPWEIEKRVAELVTSEFFEQGDIEREELKIIPIDIMNREKEDQLPMMQIGFIDTICYPIYETFSLISDSLIPLLNGVLDNRRHWLERAKINNLEIPARDVQDMMNNGFV